MIGKTIREWLAINPDITQMPASRVSMSVKSAGGSAERSEVLTQDEANDGPVNGKRCAHQTPKSAFPETE